MSKELIPAINSLKFKYLLVAGHDATLLLIPKRRSFVKQFCEDLNRETFGECGSAPQVFDKLWRLGESFSICDLDSQMYDGDDLAVGNPA